MRLAACTRATFSPIHLLFWFTLALLVYAGSAAAAPGDLIGKTLTRVPGGDNQLNRALVQPDGKIIVVGAARFGTMQYQVTRYNANGTLDTSFNSSGTILEPLGPGNGAAWAVALQGDGKVVVAGNVRSDRDKFGIARFNTDGTLDLTFGGGGSAVAIGPGDAGAFAMAIQADGKIVLGGYSMTAASGGRKVFTLARYNANDTIDTTFGTNGFAIAPAGAADEVVNAIGIQSDGRIVAAGSMTGGLRMMRFNGNGSIDGTWATPSLTYISGGRDLVVQGDDKVAIVGNVAGGAVSEVGVLRMNANGSVDTTFGNGSCALGPCPGVAHMSISDSVTGYGVAIQSGKYVVSGDTLRPAGQGTAVALGRFTATGAVDTAFGSNGSVAVQPTGSGDMGRGLALRADGRIVVAGQANGSLGDYDAMTVAFTANGQLDTTFNGTGFSRIDVGSMTGEWRAAALQSDGSIVAAGTTTRESHTATPGAKGGILARYLANGALDASFGAGGLVQFGWPANAIAIQPNGGLVVAGYSLTGSNVPSMTFARYLGNGTIDASFGTNGTVVLTPTSSDEEIQALAIQNDGMIVGAGLQASGAFFDSVFVRLTSAGALDPAFNGGSKKVVAMSTGSDLVNAVAIQPDGRIVGAGWAEITGSQDSIAATRLDTNGSLDATFGSGGVAVANFGTQTSKGYALVLQPDGKLAIGGSVFNGTTDDFAVARFLSNGALDAAFGTGGLAASDFGNHNRIFGMIRLPSGKLLGAGETGGFFSLVQYLPGGGADASFGAGGSRAVQINAGNDFANAVVLGLDGAINALGNGSGVLALARFESDVAATPPADLAVAMAANMTTAGTGKDVIFTITATNQGPNAATGVVVTDTPPPGWMYVWSSPGCAGTGVGTTIACAAGSLAANATARFTVVLRPTNPLAATNTASVAGNETDPNLANNSASVTMGVNLSPAGVATVRYRLYNPLSQEHLYTTDQNEYNVLGGGGVWVQEGTAGKVLNNPGSFNGVEATPYYRLYNTFTLWHHWTTDPNEYYTLLTFPGWNGEGVDGYLLPTNTAGATQLYRLVYPDGRGLHHWTVDANEYNTLISVYGWVGEGGTGFVIQ